MNIFFGIIIFFLTKLIVCDSFCNKTGFAGPGCIYLDCGKNGFLNSEGTKCNCLEGWQGIRCGQCNPTPIGSSSTRTYICCPLKGITNSQWFLLGPKNGDVSKFLAGLYTAIPCLIPNSIFQQDSNTSFNLDCSCHLIPIDNNNNNNNQPEKRSLNENENDVVTLPPAKRFPKTNDNLYQDDLFWKQQISVRDLYQQNNPFNAENLADILAGEIGFLNIISQSSVSGNENAVISSSSSCSAQPFSTGGKGLLAIIIIVIVVALFLFAFFIYWMVLQRRNPVIFPNGNHKNFNQRLQIIEDLMKNKKELNKKLSTSKKKISNTKTKKGLILD